MATIRIELKPFLQSVFAVLILEFCIGLVENRLPVNALLQLGILRIMEIVILLFICCCHGIATPCLGISVDTMRKGFIWGLVWSVGFGVMVTLFGIVLFYFHIDMLTLLKTRLPSNHLNIVFFFLVGGIIGPVAEELFFRGLVYGFFRQWGFWVALLISTTVFAAAHGMNLSYPLIPIVGGALFAFAYEKTGNLITPITIHVLGNSTLFGLSLFNF